MKSGLEVVAHPTGPWLIRAGTVIYAVPAELGRPLIPWHGCRPTATELAAQAAPPGTDPDQWAGFMAALIAALGGQDSPHESRVPPPIWLRVPLLPARVVQPVARRLAGLTSGRGLVVLSSVGLAGYAHLGLTAAANPIDLAPGSAGPALVLFLVTALWHELGHAAALARHRYPPGGIGLGLLFVIPVLFADVTAIGVLPRAGRVRVDVAGIAFQFGLGGLLAVIGTLSLATSPLIIASWLALLAVGWSLFPFIRSDGYWLVCDLLGLADLEATPEPTPGLAVRLFLGGYRLANAVFLMAVGVFLPLRYAHRAEAVLAHFGLEVSRTRLLIPLVLVTGLALGLLWWNILRRVTGLAKAAWRIFSYRE